MFKRRRRRVEVMDGQTGCVSIGRQVRTGELVLPDAVQKEDGPFACCDCGGTLILKRGPVKRPHFAHHTEYGASKTLCCTGESAQHQAAKLLFTHYWKDWTILTCCSTCGAEMERMNMNDPSFSQTYHVVTEFPLAPYVIDVVVFDALTKRPVLLVEVWHEHRIPKEKHVALQKQGIPLVEVSAREILNYERHDFHLHNVLLQLPDRCTKQCPTCQSHRLTDTSHTVANMGSSSSRSSDSGLRRCHDCREVFDMNGMHRFSCPRWFVDAATAQQSFRRYGWVCDRHKVACDSCHRWISQQQAKRFKRCLDCNQKRKAVELWQRLVEQQLWVTDVMRFDRCLLQDMLQTDRRTPASRESGTDSETEEEEKDNDESESEQRKRLCRIRFHRSPAVLRQLNIKYQEACLRDRVVKSIQSGRTLRCPPKDNQMPTRQMLESYGLQVDRRDPTRLAIDNALLPFVAHLLPPLVGLVLDHHLAV